MKLTREFYIATIPQHAQKITVKVDGSVIYKWEQNGKILLKVRYDCYGLIFESWFNPSELKKG